MRLALPLDQLCVIAASVAYLVSWLVGWTESADGSLFLALGGFTFMPGPRRSYDPYDPKNYDKGQYGTGGQQTTQIAADADKFQTYVQGQTGGFNAGMGVLGGLGNNNAQRYTGLANNQANVAGGQQMALGGLGRDYAGLGGAAISGQAANAGGAYQSLSNQSVANQQALAQLSAVYANNAIGEANAYGQDNVSNRNFLGQMAAMNAYAGMGGGGGGGGMNVSGPQGAISTGSYTGGGGGGGGYGGGGNLLSTSNDASQRLYGAVGNAFQASRAGIDASRGDLNKNFTTGVDTVKGIRDLTSQDIRGSQAMGNAGINSVRGDINAGTNAYYQQANAGYDKAGQEAEIMRGNVNTRMDKFDTGLRNDYTTQGQPAAPPVQTRQQKRDEQVQERSDNERYALEDAQKEWDRNERNGTNEAIRQRWIQDRRTSGGRYGSVPFSRPTEDSPRGQPMPGGY